MISNVKSPVSPQGEPKHPELPIGFTEPLRTRNRQSRINRYLKRDSSMKTEIKTKAERCVGVGAYETGMQGPEDKLKRIPVQVLREIRNDFALYRKGNNQRIRKSPWTLKIRNS